MSAPLARLIWKNAKEIKKKLDVADKKRVKAGETATRVRAFKLWEELAKEIRRGGAGGNTHSPLTAIARRYQGKFVTRKPFTKLHSTSGAGQKAKTRGILPVRYNAGRVGGQFKAEVGFIDTKQGRLSKSWKEIAKKQQEGFTIPATEKKRAFLARIASKFSGRSRLKKYFFLKKSTRQFKIPARPIIDPFWAAHRADAARKIIRDFERKMAGERI